MNENGDGGLNFGDFTFLNYTCNSLNYKFLVFWSQKEAEFITEICRTFSPLSPVMCSVISTWRDKNKSE